MRRPPWTTSLNSNPMRPGKARVSGGAGVQQSSRALDFEVHQRGPGVVDAAGIDLPFGHAEALQVLLRQVDATLAPVDGDVLPEVGELQAGADGVRPRHRLLVAAAVQREQQAADRVGRAPAVVAQVSRTIRSAWSSRPVRTPTAGRGIARAAGCVPGSPRRGPASRWHGRSRSVELLPQPGQRAQPFCRRRVTLVGEVVGGAGEAIDRPDGGAQRRRRQQRCNGKVLVVTDTHANHASTAGPRLRRRSPSARIRRSFRAVLACGRGAKVAKLVDAPGLGPDAFTGVGVRVPPFAPTDSYLPAHPRLSKRTRSCNRRCRPRARLSAGST